MLIQRICELYWKCINSCLLRLNSTQMLPVRYLIHKGNALVIVCIPLAVLSLVLVNNSSPLFIFADSLNPGVYSIDSKPFGHSYAEWAAKWWQWAYSIPKSNNPVSDTSGAYCSVGQNGSIWFLAGTYGGSASRSCTIPAGKGIMVPIFNAEGAFAEEKGVSTEEELRAMVKDYIDTTTILEGSVDGIPLKDIKNYRVESPKFVFNYPNDNVVGLPAGTTSEVVSDGYWIILEPPSPGKHEIHFKGANSQFTTTGVQNFATEVRYNLEIK
jgi:hypothetical protein